MAAEHEGDASAAVGHAAVMPTEVLDLLAPAPVHSCLDCTVGRGGHGVLIVPRLVPGGRFVGLDVDPDNVAFARERLAAVGASGVQIDIRQANFAHARAVLDDLGIDRVDLLLADLGFASTQMADASRGLSFQHDGPLDMRLDPELSVTAADLVNRLPQRELADVIYRYGEERQSRKIARIIVDRRQRDPIMTTGQLADLVRRALGAPRHGRRGGRTGPPRIDPATRTFMALRIAVNDELQALERLLADLPRVLGPGSVAVIISFHSLEDRMVKQALVRWKQEEHAQVLTRKPMTANEEERRANPRSRSAKLRALRWIGPANV